MPGLRSSALTSFAVAAVAMGVLLLGPRARVGGSVSPVDPGQDLEGWVAQREEAVPGIRSGDAKSIAWADPSAPSPTPLAVVYLHGFSADRHELSPVAERVAAELRANLFFTRLTGHGRDGPAMAEATAEAWLQDTEEALAVGARLGRRVVLIGTSTGATLAMWAAAQERWADRLAAIVLISPNLGPRDRNSEILLWPWGGVLARVAIGPERCFSPLNADQARHWTTCYPTRALLPMMALVDEARALDPSRIRVPALLFFSPDDQVVDARRTQAAFDRFGSALKEAVVIDRSDDPAHHVLAGDIVSPSTTDTVVARIVAFAAVTTSGGGP